MVYNDVPTFDYREGSDWKSVVDEAVTIMRAKLRITGKQGGRFLDVGCSEGVYVAGASMLGWRSTGVDIDAPKVKRASARGLDVHCLDIVRDSQFIVASDDWRNRFDFVLLRHVVEHVPDFTGLVRCAGNLLAPDGVLCVECPNQASIAALMSRHQLKEDRFVANLYPPTHVHAFEPRSFRRFAQRADMTCLSLLTYAQSDPQWFLPSQHSGTWPKGLLQRVSARLGFGGNIALFLRPNRPVEAAAAR